MKNNEYKKVAEANMSYADDDNVSLAEPEAELPGDEPSAVQ